MENFSTMNQYKECFLVELVCMRWMHEHSYLRKKKKKNNTSNFRDFFTWTSLTWLYNQNVARSLLTDSKASFIFHSGRSSEILQPQEAEQMHFPRRELWSTEFFRSQRSCWANENPFCKPMLFWNTQQKL